MAELKATFGAFVPPVKRENPWTAFVQAFKEASDAAIAKGDKPLSAIVEVPAEGFEKSMRQAREAANDADRTLKTVAVDDAVKDYSTGETYKVTTKGARAVEVRLTERVTITRKPAEAVAE